jgi:pseudouridine synthase
MAGVSHTIKLVKLLTDRRVDSRRAVKALILEGRVTVNDRIVEEPAFFVDPKKDLVRVDGKKIPAPPPRLYLLFHKPKGCLTAMKDGRGRKTVADYLPKPVRSAKVYPVGRLDFQSEGLIFLTNDGDLANYLLSTHVEKRYHVKVSGVPKEKHIRFLQRGIRLEGGVRSRPCTIRFLRTTKTNNWYEVGLREGKKNQIRQMFKTIGHSVLKLKRISIGPFHLGKIASGGLKPAAKADLQALRQRKKEAGKQKKEKGGQPPRFPKRK